MARKLILDCDPGHDDAFAMLAAYGHPSLELIAVTTVCGNQTVELVTDNALSVAAVAGMTGVLFAKGADRPLLRKHRAAPEIHGDSGMDGPPHPVGVRPSVDPRPAAALIVDLVMAAEPGEITLVATAPLTNLAIAVALEPRIADRVAEVAIMGGAINQGNMTPSAEFNIKVDPEAAAMVFNAGWRVTMMGLEVSHQALASPSVRSRIRDLDNEVGVFADQLLDFFGARYLQHQGFAEPPVHDLCPVVYLVDPTVFDLVRAPVQVETGGGLADGRTVVDLRAPAAPDCRHTVSTGMDAARFWDVVLAGLGGID